MKKTSLKISVQKSSRISSICLCCCNFFFSTKSSTFSMICSECVYPKKINIAIRGLCGKNMLDVHVIPRCVMSTRQWSRPETNVCWETTCRHTVTFATQVSCARTLFKAKFLFELVLNTLLAESETWNALVVMVCSGERSTQSTQRITERDTAQTERILTRLVFTARP